MAMRKDPTEFRERFKAYKDGKNPYENGLPKYKGGKNPWDDSVDFITKYEGWSDTAYQKKGDKPTIGYGTTNPKWVSKGKITINQGRAAMAEDLALGEPLLRKNIMNYDKFPDSAKTVLRDILYNVGQGNLFNKSPKFMKAINSGNYAEAARQMDWDNNKPGMSGAKKRNAARQALFLQDLQNNPVVQESELVQQMKQKQQFQPWSNYHSTDYPINNPAPASISSWNSPQSPAYTPIQYDSSQTYLKLPDIKDVVEQIILKPMFKNGKLPGYKNGKIYIKPANRGKFTALKKRTGHSASWFKKNGTPAQKKMATFELNSRKWSH